MPDFSLRKLTPTAFALLASLGATSAQEVVVNAAVAPDAIYVARGGSEGGVSVIDLNGFGATAGAPDFTFMFGARSEGETRFPWNPNLNLQGSLLQPPLAAGMTNNDGGSRGVFSLTVGSDSGDVLLRQPSFDAISDMALGASLDLVFNNSIPFGCQQGGGNLCAHSGLQVVNVTQAGPHTVRPAGPGDQVIHSVIAGGNPISFAPHPNPPPYVDPPLCSDPFIAGLEPTSVDTALFNLLVPGDPFGNPSIGLPPTGLLSLEQNAFFVGPSLPQQNISLCNTFAMRQQVGHFLYLADPTAGEVLVVNSNTFEVLDRVAVPNPVELAIGPNLDFLAVTDRLGGSVHFISVDPASPSFHSLVKSTEVGHRPRGIAWDPGNEDILVCNEGDDSISVLSVTTLSVRKTVAAQGMRHPFAIAITPRQDTFGLQRDVYFAYILDRNGSLWLFESGPDGVNGWGFDDIVGRAPRRFQDAAGIQPDHVRLEGGVWITHRSPAGGVVSNMVLEGNLGRQPLVPGDLPNLRDITIGTAATIGPDQLTGFPKDLAFDNQRNYGVLPNVANAFSAGIPATTNGKGLIRSIPGMGVVNTNEPAYLFVSVHGADAGPGAIDVIHISSGQRIDTNVFQAGIQSIPAAGARLLMDYFRQ